jgi:hypothetical protein
VFLCAAAAVAEYCFGSLVLCAVIVTVILYSGPRCRLVKFVIVHIRSSFIVLLNLFLEKNDD